MNTMNDNGVHTKLTDIAGELRGETEKAFRIRRCQNLRSSRPTTVTFTMPEWLAKDKGFI